MSTIDVRIGLFKDDLRTLGVRRTLRKHIIFGDCQMLSQEQYLQLKLDVSEHFSLHPSEVLVVGSAKMGFTIKPPKPYRHFGDTSDIDVVIVSPKLFDSFWYALYEYNRNGGYWEKFPSLKNYLFRGWIRPDKFPPGSSFEPASDWWEFFRELTKSNKFGPFKISGAVYRNWDFLEDYQSKCVEQCHRTLMGT